MWSECVYNDVFLVGIVQVSSILCKLYIVKVRTPISKMNYDIEIRTYWLHWQM